MERIAELLAKGIETLTPEELAELDQLLLDEGNAILDKEDGVSDEDLKVLQEISAGVQAVQAENARRIEAEEARIVERDRLAAEIRGESVETEDEGDADVDEAEAVADGEAEAETEGEAEPVVETEAELEPIAAASAAPASPAPRPVSVPRPAAAPRRAASAVQALTAAANLPGVQGGRNLNDPAELFAAFDAAQSLAMTASSDMKMPVAVSRAAYSSDRTLTHDAERNAERLSAVVAPEALVASGGICAPVPYRYDLPVVGETGRPVRDGAMAKFGVQGTRGGIKTFVPPTISDVDGLDGPVSIWTEANDQSPSDPTTKPYLTIDCTNSESESRVYAIPVSFKVGNFRDRWFPENVKAFVDLTAVWQARVAEAKLLQAIATGSKVVTHSQILGSAQDVFTSIRQLIAGIRYRHRINDAVRFRVIGFTWVRDNIITDMIRKGSGDVTDARLRLSAATEVDAYFSALGVNVTWSPDFEYGKSVGQNGGPLAGTQGVGPVIGYPDKARFYVYPEGAWLFLDGGELNLGVIRDSTLVGTNDMLMFSETFEGSHYHSVPGESYVYDIDICANGGVASALDIAPCNSGS